MLKGLHHVGIAVAELDRALELYTGPLGAGLVRRGSQPGIEFALLNSGGVELELLASDDRETAIGKFVAERGSGLHHLAYAVDDIQAEIARLLGEGFEQSGEVRTGVHGTPIVFFHPKTTGGVLTELVETHG
jgi:methylmalonyl-CoA/ethylmalonyl-CoA epimerase